MTDAARQQHAVLILAAIRCEAMSLRLSDKTFRAYVRELTQGLDLPNPILEDSPRAA